LRVLSSPQALSSDQYICDYPMFTKHITGMEKAEKPDQTRQI
jgi:hypothetical protein